MAALNTKLGYGFKLLARRGTVAAALGFAASAFAAPVVAQSETALLASPAERATYADLTDLAERSEFVIRAEIRRQTVVEPERAPGLPPGFARLYIEARTQALLAGPSALGESLVYLVDVPVNARGKPDKFKDRVVVLFADSVSGRPGSLQLTGKQAQLDYSPALEARLRSVLSALVASDAPPVVTGVRDALAVQGTLTGESETQIFLATNNSSPVSITVLRRPGQRPVWGVSWGEIIDSAARPPQPETLRWYRLACALPERLPSSANLARDPDARRLAEADYAFVIHQMGPCAREITEAG
ncbi:hypothetical protein [Qipengyuania sp. ASV99]|uniref:hypothetical protein n=1 Tax=Qipengyuania sp. ASV99 TaxID=3399681 RepID=UPI003A4C61D1